MARKYYVAVTTEQTEAGEEKITHVGVPHEEVDYAIRDALAYRYTMANGEFVFVSRCRLENGMVVREEGIDLAPVHFIETDNGLEPDNKDDSIASTRLFLFNKFDGPRIGDFIVYADGVINRICYHHGDRVQTTGAHNGRYYIGHRGVPEYSGGLDPSIPTAELLNSGQTRLGVFWFFHHNISRAHYGISFETPCRVFACERKHNDPR